MRSTFSFSLILAFILATTLSVSCKKYEEGPGISLRSRKGRAAGNWLRYKMDINGTNQLLILDLRLEMEKGGKFRSSNTDSNGNVVSEASGGWFLSDDKEQIVIDIVSADTSVALAGNVYWDIVRLKNDDLWVEYVDNGATYEIRFRAQK